MTDPENTEILLALKSMTEKLNTIIVDINNHEGLVNTQQNLS